MTIPEYSSANTLSRDVRAELDTEGEYIDVSTLSSPGNTLFVAEMAMEFVSEELHGS